MYKVEPPLLYMLIGDIIHTLNKLICRTKPKIGPIFSVLKCWSVLPLDVENRLEDMGRRRGKLGRSERVAWTYIHYQM